MEVGEGGGFGWGGVEGWGEKADNCNWITINFLKKICYRGKLLDSKKCLWIRPLWLIFYFLTFQNALGFPCLHHSLCAYLAGLIAKFLLNLFLGMRLVISSLEDFHLHKDTLGRKYPKELYIPSKALFKCIQFVPLIVHMKKLNSQKVKSVSIQHNTWIAGTRTLMSLFPQPVICTEQFGHSFLSRMFKTLIKDTVTSLMLMSLLLH